MDSINLVNEKLEKAWEIIDGKYNFLLPDFINEPTEDNIMVSFVKIRIATEAVCRFVVVYEGLVKESNIKDPRLSTYMDWINRSFEIKDSVKDVYIPHIQKTCNEMVHYKDEPLTLKEAKSCAETFGFLLEWFVSNYSDAEDNDLRDIMLKGNTGGIIPDKVKGFFISRENDSKCLANTLEKQGYACIVSPAGTGKTELCKDYVERFKSKYNRVYYVENPASAMQFVYDVPFKVNDVQNIRKEKVLEKKVKHFKKLNESEKKNNKKFLFILDNYEGSNKDDLEYLYAILPEIPGRVHVIITSTTKVGNLDFIAPSLPQKEDCVYLFRQFNQKAILDEWVERLVDVLRYNLRGIRMTASFIDNHFQGINLEDFLLQLCKNEAPEAIFDQLCMAMLDENDEMDFKKRRILTLLTFITPSGVRVDEFQESLKTVFSEKIDPREINDAIEELAQDGWFSIIESKLPDEDEVSRYIEISPIISETLFIKMCSNVSEEYIMKYIVQLLKKIESADKLTELQLEELKPLIDHVSKRLVDGNCSDYYTLRTIRDYYIAAYDTKKTQILTDRINDLANQEAAKQEKGDIKQAFYKEGIANLNIEEFENAARLLGENIKQNEERIDNLKQTIAMASAHCAHALARIGRHEEAIQTGMRSIQLREELIKAGYKGEEKYLWVSYYNYAMALFFAGDLKAALENCETSITLFPPMEEKEEYYVNISSPLHLRGQIYMAMEDQLEYYLEKAIEDLKNSRSIRAEKKGNTFWIAQLNVYLCEAFEKRGDLRRACGNDLAVMDYLDAETCAKAALTVKLKQFKTDNMIKQIEALEEIIKRIAKKREMCYESFDGSNEHTE